MNRQLEKIAQVEPLAIDGADWYSFREICDVLRVQPKRAREHVRAENARLVMETRHFGQRTQCRYINRAAVRELAIRYGTGSCSELLAALRMSGGIESRNEALAQKRTATRRH